MEAERRAAMVLRSIVVLLLADTDLALAVVYYFDWARALSTCSSRRLVKRGIHGCIFSARSHIFLSILPYLLHRSCEYRGLSTLFSKFKFFCSSRARA